MRKSQCSSFEAYRSNPLKVDPWIIWEHFSNCASCMENFQVADGLARERLTHCEFAGELKLARDVLSNRSGANDTASQPSISVKDEQSRRPEISGYIFGRLLGRGGCGEVWLARQDGLERFVAIKIMHKTTLEQKRRLERECRILASLSHPNLLPIYANGMAENRVWMALEYCPGGSLNLDAPRQWDAREAATLVMKVALAVQAVHEKGIIHRDIKPGNILLGSDGEPKLADFDLAGNIAIDQELNAQTQILGTPSYIAPEQVKSKSADARTDIHALGGVLYYLLTGRPPFKAETPYETLLLAAHTNPVPPATFNPDLSRDIDQICLKCLAKNSEDRYPTAKELASDLIRFREGRPVKARPLSTPKLAWRWAIRNKVLATTGSGTILLLILVAVISVIATLQYNKYSNDIKKAYDDVSALNEASKLNEENAKKKAAKAKEYEKKSISDLYFTRINAANASLEVCDPEAAQDQLEQCPFALRGWEHDYLSSLLYAKHMNLANLRNQITALSISPDDNVIAIGCGSRLYIWDLDNISRSPYIILVPSPLKFLYFSTNERRLAGGCLDGSILNWETKTWQLINEFKSGPSAGSTIFQASDGEVIAFSEKTKFLSIYEKKEKKILFEKSIGDVSSNAISLSPDGGLLACGGKDGILRILNFRTFEVIREFRAARSIGSVAWSPNSDRLAIAKDEDMGNVVIIDTATCKEVMVLPGHGWRPLTLAFGKDGRTLASGGTDKSVIIWDWQTGKKLHELKGHKNAIDKICICSGCNIVVSASRDGVVKIWNLNGNQFPVFPSPQEGDPVISMVEDPTRRGIIAGTRRGDIYFLDKDGLTLSRKLSGTCKTVTNLDIASDQPLLAWGSEDHTISIFDLKENKIRLKVKYRGDLIDNLQFINGGKKLFGSNKYLDFCIIDTKSGELINEFTASKIDNKFIGQSSSVRPILCEGENTLVFLDADKSKLIAIALDNLNIRKEIKFPAEILSFSSNKNNDEIIVACDDRALYAASLSKSSSYKVAVVGRSIVNVMKYSPDGSKFITKDADSRIRIWNAETKTCLISIDEKKGSITDALFSRDDKSLFITTSKLGIKKYSANLKCSRFNVVENVVQEIKNEQIRKMVASSGGEKKVSEKKKSEKESWNIKMNGTFASSEVNSRQFDADNGLGKYGSLFLSQGMRQIKDGSDSKRFESDPETVHIFDRVNGSSLALDFRNFDYFSPDEPSKWRSLEIMADESGIFIIDKGIEAENRRIQREMLKNSMSFTRYFRWSFSHNSSMWPTSQNISHLFIWLNQYYLKTSLAGNSKGSK